MASEGYAHPPDQEPIYLDVGRMTRTEFDDWDRRRRTEHLYIRCVNPNCRGRMYFQRRKDTQLLAHFPGAVGGDPACPKRSGESETHAEFIARIGENFVDLGYAVETNKKLGRLARRPDVQAFDRDKPSSYGPKMVAEVQESRIDIAEFDARSNAIDEQLNEFRSLYGTPRPSLWLTSFTPSWASSRAHIQANADQWHTVNGLHAFDAGPDGDPLIVPLDEAVTGILNGRIIRVDDQEWVAGLADPRRLTYWRAPRGLVAQTGARKTGHRARVPTEISRSCDRNGAFLLVTRCDICGAHGTCWRDVDGAICCGRCLANRDSEQLALAFAEQSTSPTTDPREQGPTLLDFRQSEAWQRGTRRAEAAMRQPERSTI